MQSTDASTAGNRSLAYLVSRYPAVSHTFILQEVGALRALGWRVEVASVNAPDRALVDMPDDERSEARATYGLKAHGVAGALAALAWAAVVHPAGLARALVQALRYGRGLRRVYALAYAVEAAMVARWMHAANLHHLHVHFGNEGAAVGTLVKALTGAGLSLTIHGPDEFDDVPGQQLAHKVAAADRVLCISQFGRSQLMRLTAPTLWPKLALCRLGVDLHRFVPGQRAAAGGPVRLLCVGRLTPAKAQALLLQACARLQALGLDFELTVVGDGPDRERLARQVQQSGLAARVRFTGALAPAQVRQALARADVFVLPSLAEGIPVVLMEAMASGVPCLSCPVGGIPELIEHERSGLLAPPGDVDALAAALHRLISDPALRQRLAKGGLARVREAYQLRDSVARVAAAFEGLLAPAPRQAAGRGAA